MLVEFVKTLFGNKAQRGLLGELFVRFGGRLQDDKAFLQSLESVKGLKFPLSGAWHLVNLTQQHPKYKADYRFPSESDGWIRPLRCGPVFLFLAIARIGHPESICCFINSNK